MLRKNTTVEELVESARELDKDKTTIFYKIPDIELVNPVEHKITLGGTEYQLTNYALKQFLQKMKIPFTYFLQCSPELREREVGEGLRDIASPKVEYAFKIKEDKIYGIVSKAYCQLPTSDILGYITSHLPPGLSLNEFQLNLEGLTARFIADNQEFIENDTLKSMVDIGFSEVGAMPFQITSAVFRQVCTNGMMLPEGLAPSFRMPMARFKREVLEGAVSSIPDRMYGSMQPFMDTFEGLKEIQLPQASTNDDLAPEIDSMLNLVLPSRVLQRDYKSLVLDHYNLDQNLTANGVVNAVTRTARDLESNDKFKLEQSAGAFLSRVVKGKQAIEGKGGHFDFTQDRVIELFAK